MSLSAGYIYPLVGVAYTAQRPKQTLGTMVGPLVVGTAAAAGWTFLCKEMAPALSRNIALLTLDDSSIAQTTNGAVQLAIVVGAVGGSITLLRLATAVARKRAFWSIVGGNSQPHEPLATAAWRTVKWLGYRLLVAAVASPLNAIPVIGTATYLFINGVVYTWELLGEYMYQRGFVTLDDQWAYAQQYIGRFGAFGATAMALESLFPAFAPLVVVTNTVGAALFAKDLDGLKK